jgi:hypothetical protein
MRRRRIQRCVLRASIALEAGFLDDARAAIDEAATLDSHDQEIQAIRARVAAAEAAPPLETPVSADIHESVVAIEGDVGEIEGSARKRWAAAAATLLVAAGISGIGVWGVRTRPESVTPARQPVSSLMVSSNPSPVATRPASLSSEVEPIVSASPEAEPSADPRGGAGTETEVQSTVATAGDATRATEPVAAIEALEPPNIMQPPASTELSSAFAAIGTTVAPPPAGGSAGPPALASSPAPLLRDIAVPAAPALPESQPLPPPVASVPELDPPAVRQPIGGVPAVAASRVSPSTLAAKEPADESLVRAALGRYETAYSRLDAAAAGAVWPSVDRRALARAFDGLASQTVRLDRCDVRLNGATAQADCTGIAQWTPKVGGGNRTAARRWRFDLKHTGSDWLIVSATTR